MQVLLVAMYDTIRGQAWEYARFKNEIPAVARVLIPTWRRALYNPRAQCLEVETEALVTAD
jgi:hypothetical protein